MYILHVAICAILQYSNVYVTMPEVHQLLNNAELQKECLDYVSLPGV